jgi:hypothetical protein
MNDELGKLWSEKYNELIKRRFFRVMMGMKISPIVKHVMELENEIESLKEQLEDKQDRIAHLIGLIVEVYKDIDTLMDCGANEQSYDRMLHWKNKISMMSDMVGKNKRSIK